MITYGIIEDQTAISTALRLSIENLRPDYQCVFVAASVGDALEMLRTKGNPNLLFVDVELEDGICFDLFDATNISSAIIFTTAFPDKVFEAFHMRQSIDYLVKPYDDSDLLAAITKFEELRLECHADTVQLNQLTEIANSLMSRIQGDTHRHPQRILTTAGDRFDSINLAEVAWLCSEDKYVMVITRKGCKLFSTFSSLSEAEEALPQQFFFRANRKYLVSFECINSVHKSFGGKLSVEISVANHKEKILVPFAKRSAFLSWYGAGKF